MNRKNLIGESVVDNHFRVKTIAYCVALALSQLGVVGLAQADSAVGQYTTLGNDQTQTVNPVEKQANGMLDQDSLVPTRRTPTGQMYNVPFTPPEEAAGNGPVVHGTIDAAAQSVNGQRGALYDTYRDVKSSVGVDSFSLQIEKPADATYLEAVGGGIGRDDQFYGVQFGKFNDWKVKGFYNETPHVFTETAKVIWNGAGTNMLTLPNSIPKGGGLTWVGNNATAQAAGAVVAAGNYCGAPAGGTALAAGAPCFSSAVYGSPVGTAAYNVPTLVAATNAITAGTVVNPIFVGTPFSAASAGAAPGGQDYLGFSGVIQNNGGATVASGLNTTNGGINAFATRAIINLQNSMGYSELELIRKAGGISLEKNIDETLKFFTAYTGEKRVGGRPFGMVQGGGGGANNIQIVEPVNYVTQDFKMGLRYAGERNQANVTAAVNLFTDNYNSLTVDVPYNVAATQTGVLIQQGRFALTPSNKAYNLKGEFAHAMPEFYKANFTGTVAWNSARQNEDLLPVTVTQGIGNNANTTGSLGGTTAAAGAGGFNGDFGQWNGSKGRPTFDKSSNARIDNKLANFKFSLHPIEDLTLATNLRYQKQDTETRYIACNPSASYANGVQFTGTLNGKTCTGLWGRMLNDGGSLVFFNPGTSTSGPISMAGGAVTAVTATVGGAAAGGALTGVTGATLPSWTANGPVASIPWGNTTKVYNFTGDYRINKTSSANFAIERETVDRVNREVDTTKENKFKIGYTNRDIRDMSVRVSYENDSKRGTVYNSFSPYINFGGTAFIDPNTIPTNTSLTAAYVPRVNDIHKLDVADRDQNILNLRVNYAVRDNLDLGLTGNYKSSMFPQNTAAGMHDLNVKSLGLELNYQPSADLQFFGNFSYQDQQLNQNEVQNTAPKLNGMYACTMGTVTPWGTINAYTAESICGTVSHNITFDPLETWHSQTHDMNNVLNLGAKLSLAQKKVLTFNYTYSQSTTKISYQYSDPNALITGTANTVGQWNGTNNGQTLVASQSNNISAVPIAQAALAGTGLPDNSFVSNRIGASLLVPLDKQMAVRINGSYEDGKTVDWHYPTNMGAGQLCFGANNSCYLDAGPQSYHVSAVSVVFNYKL